MIRLFAILAGFVFATVVMISFFTGFYTWATEDKVLSAEYEFYEHPQQIGFAQDGILGRWDNAQLQRGYKVYKEVCAACHSLKYVAFRDLAALGYTEDEVKALAAEWQVPGVDQATGEAILVPGKPQDYFPEVYPNNVAAAAANNNAIPPDLSLMTKARHDGTAYVASLLAGYGDYRKHEKNGKRLVDEFPEFETPTGLYFNKYFPNLNIAMAPPLTATGQVTYDDGTEATIGQMSTDVAAFMAWTAEPKMQQRKQTGVWFIGFLIFATILAYLAYRNIWAGLKTQTPVRRDTDE
ncbi:MAG: cytochrome c1 [Parerythrobacter sp.]